MKKAKARYIRGYGVRVSASDEEIRDFIIKHKDTVMSLSCEMKEEVVMAALEKERDDFNPKEDFFDWDNINTGTLGIYGLIADVMTVETNIIFSYYWDRDEHDEPIEYIVFEAVYPWEKRRSKKKATKADIDRIFREYMKEFASSEHSPVTYLLETYG